MNGNKQRYESIIRGVAKLILLIDQRVYDVISIVLIGAAVNIIVSDAGKENVYLLLFVGILLLLSGSAAVYLRSKSVTIDANATKTHLVNKQVLNDLILINDKNKETVERKNKLAKVVAEGLSKVKRDEIEKELAESKNVWIVILTFAVFISLAWFAIYCTIKEFNATSNSNSVDAKHNELMTEISLMRTEIYSLSSTLKSYYITMDSIKAVQLETNNTIKDLQYKVNAHSESLTLKENESVPLSTSTE